VSSQRSLKIAANEHTSFTVAILLFYNFTRALLDQKSQLTTDSALGDWSRAFLQDHSLTKHASGHTHESPTSHTVDIMTHS